MWESISYRKWIRAGGNTPSDIDKISPYPESNANAMDDRTASKAQGGTAVEFGKDTYCLTQWGGSDPFPSNHRPIRLSCSFTTLLARQLLQPSPSLRSHADVVLFLSPRSGLMRLTVHPSFPNGHLCMIPLSVIQGHVASVSDVVSVLPSAGASF